MLSKKDLKVLDTSIHGIQAMLEFWTRHPKTNELPSYLDKQLGKLYRKPKMTEKDAWKFVSTLGFLEMMKAYYEYGAHVAEEFTKAIASANKPNKKEVVN